MSKKKQIREKCYFKTGRDGVVIEFLDELYPNLFENNKSVNNDIFKQYSSFKVTLVDARKTDGKGKAVYYNLGPEEVITLTYLLSDGNPEQFKKRVGAFNALSGLEQVSVKKIAETFDTMNFARFDALIRKNQTTEGTMVSFQKNFNTDGDKLSVRKFTLSFEEGMRSASKWKVTIEEGFARKDPKGNGLNVVAPGSYNAVYKTSLNLQFEEIVIPINEASQRVMLGKSSFYALMKRAEVDFTERKLESKDYYGERIDEWNPQGKSKYVPKETPSSTQTNSAPQNSSNQDNSTGANKNTPQNTPKSSQPPQAPQTQNSNIKPISDAPSKNACKCSDCGTGIYENIKNFSERTYGRALCMKCQNVEKGKKRA